MNKVKLTSGELQVEGFHCVDCAVTLEKTVSKLGGVHNVNANFTTGTVHVDYNAEKVGRDDLVDSVQRIGYKVRSDGHKNLEKKNLWQDRVFYFTLIAGLILGFGLAIKFLSSDPKLFDLWGRNITISIVLFLLSIGFGGFYLARTGWASIKILRFNMDVLMSIAIVGAIIIQEYIEAASLAFLFSLAELLESYAVERARNSLRSLIKIAPDDAVVKIDHDETIKPIHQVKVNDIIITRPGEKIALDGIVLEGSSSVDQAPITGESVPVKKEEGDKVFAGSINIEGYLEIRVTEHSGNTMLARIIQLIEDAEAQKAPSQRFVDKFAKIYTPVIVGLAVGIAIIPFLVFGSSFQPWFMKALTLLVIACPCALVISTPVSIVSALTNASRNGVLIKGGVYLEKMSQINVIAFDKTGTLTRGKLIVTDVVPLNGMKQKELLKLAASIEKQSEHPIAKAIVESAHDIKLTAVKDFESLPGKGVVAKINGTEHMVGRRELFKNGSVAFPTQQLNALQKNGKTTMLVGTASQFFGIIALMDEIRENAVETIAKLKAMGKEVVMITGDNKETAKAIADKLNIKHFKADLLPNEKVDEIKKLQNSYDRVAMVGDGINDAPALATASVGIVMGAAGSDTALETADIALMSDDLSKLTYLLELSQRGRRIIKQNIWASILIKFSLAVGVFPGFITLITAVLIGDMGASLGVIGNALRLTQFDNK